MALAAVGAAIALLPFLSQLTSQETPVYAEAASVTRLVERVDALERLQRAHSGSLGGVQSDVQQLQRAVTALTAPPPAKGKDRKSETGSIKLK